MSTTGVLVGCVLYSTVQHGQCERSFGETTAARMSVFVTSRGFDIIALRYSLLYSILLYRFSVSSYCTTVLCAGQFSRFFVLKVDRYSTHCARSVYHFKLSIHAARKKQLPKHCKHFPAGYRTRTGSLKHFAFLVPHNDSFVCRLIQSHQELYG